jgi:DNA-binding MarR family transcriptional regulator
MTERNRWFGTVSGRVAFDPTISPSAVRVYVVLVMYRNREDSTCFPSNDTLQRATGFSAATVKRALSELQERGVIHRSPRFVDGRQTTSLTTLTDACDTPGAHQ